MKAFILIGGQGTRLRPFTNTLPKPLLPVVHQPLLRYMLQVLRRHGVREAVLCTSHQAESFRRILGDGRGTGLRLRFVNEAAPLGTGGAIRNAERHMDGTSLILNGDLLNALDIGAFLASHRRSRADVSISLTRVKDPTQYGLVETDDGGRIRRFLEKPSWDEITCNTINAGAYLFEPGILQYIPRGIPYSLERGLFPQLLEDGHRLQGFVTRGYWLDIGTTEKYLQAHLDLLSGVAGIKLEGFARRGDLLVGPGVTLGKEVEALPRGQAALGRGTKVGPYVRFSGPVSVGPGCVIGQGAVLDHCVVLDGTRIGEGARLERCVVGRRCRIGAHASLGPGRALGDGSVIERFSQL